MVHLDYPAYMRQEQSKVGLVERNPAAQYTVLNTPAKLMTTFFLRDLRNFRIRPTHNFGNKSEVQLNNGHICSCRMFM